MKEAHDPIVEHETPGEESDEEADEQALLAEMSPPFQVVQDQELASPRHGSQELASLRRSITSEQATAQLTATEARRVLRLRMVRLTVVVAAALLVSPFVAALVPGGLFAVATGSMEPALPTGALIYATPAEVHVGDVVVYQSVAGHAQVHRVVDERTVDGQRYLETRGDANPASDAFLVHPDDVHGVVQGHVPLAGWLWVAPPMLYLLALLGFVGAYLGIALWDAREVLRGKLTKWLSLAVVFLLVPGAMGAVTTGWPVSDATAEVASPSPVPLSAGPVGSTSVAADANRATVTVGSPKVWKEVAMWGCDPGDTSDAGCVHATPDAYASVAGSRTAVDAADYAPDPTFYLEAHLAAPAGGQARVRLFNATDGTVVAGSEVATTSTTPVLVRSAGFTLSGGREYEFQSDDDDGGAAGEVHQVKLVSAQAYPTDTVTQVRVSGASQRSGGGGWIAPPRSALWAWDGAALDGTVSVFFEVVADGTGDARLRDVTSNTIHATISVDSATPTRIRSADLAGSLVSGNDHQVQLKTAGANALDLHLARVVIVQSGGFTKTVRYVDVSPTQATTSTGFVGVGQDGRYHADSEWGDLSAVFEATLVNSDNGQTTTARLHDDAAGAAVAGSSVSVTGTTLTRVRSGAVALNAQNGTYHPELKASGGTAELRNAWIVVHQTAGKTYDHVLAGSNDGACTLGYTLVATASSDLARLNGANVTLRGDAGEQLQVQVLSGSLVQSSGTAVSVAAGTAVEVVVDANPASAGTSTIDAELRAVCAGALSVQPVSVVFE